MKYIRQLTFGCSHTQNHYLKQCERWPVIANSMNQKMDFHNFGVNGAGFAYTFFLARKLTRLFLMPEQITHVVLQKPHPNRIICWRKEHPVDVYENDRTELGSLRKRSDRNYPRSKKQRAAFAIKVFNYEVEILHWFKELFPKARFAYYFHWADEIACDINCPDLTPLFRNLGQKAKELGMSNLGSIIDAKGIPGVYDEVGDLIWETPTIYKSGWFVAPENAHPSPKLQVEVAKKIVKWFKKG